jgi:uncharacterized protein YdeI (BOF family)
MGMFRLNGLMFFRIFAIFLLVATAGVFFTTTASAQKTCANPDGAWIDISGTVEKIMTDAIILNYGKGAITVAMDDVDRDANAYELVAGDKVTVNGKIDDDFFEKARLEACSIYVVKLGTTFFARSASKEARWVSIADPVVVSAVTLQGPVTAVGKEEFTMNTGPRKVTVEVEEMTFNPLDDQGYQKIEPGDLVRVTGNIDDDLFQGREMNAATVVELKDRDIVGLGRESTAKVN